MPRREGRADGGLTCGAAALEVVTAEHALKEAENQARSSGQVKGKRKGPEARGSRVPGGQGRRCPGARNRAWRVQGEQVRSQTCAGLNLQACESQTRLDFFFFFFFFD